MLLQGMWTFRKTQAENTHFLRKGKYHCMADLLFVSFGFSCFAYAELVTYLLDG